jgi:hypothetical protein
VTGRREYPDIGSIDFENSIVTQGSRIARAFVETGGVPSTQWYTEVSGQLVCPFSVVDVTMRQDYGCCSIVSTFQCVADGDVVPTTQRAGVDDDA